MSSSQSDLTISEPQTLRIPRAAPAWRLLFQSGTGIACTVGIPLRRFLREELELSGNQLKTVDVFLLNGMPVDDPDTALVGDGARLALASGLPGIAGLAMKQGSAVASLRAGITHTDADAAPNPRPGRITLFLYSLTLPLLAGHFLARGVFARAEQIARYSRFAPEDACFLDETAARAAELPGLLAHLPPETELLLKAAVREESR